MIAEIEQSHAKRFQHVAKLLEEGQLYARSEEAVWMCQNCGHLYKGGSVPDVCPVCQHNRGYFVPIDMAPWTC